MPPKHIIDCTVTLRLQLISANGFEGVGYPCQVRFFVRPSLLGKGLLFKSFHLLCATKVALSDIVIDIFGGWTESSDAVGR